MQQPWGRITLIDFPQVVNSHNNSQARLILQRDIQRTCEYFAGQGVSCNPEAILDALWTQYLAPSPENRAADESRLAES